MAEKKAEKSLVAEAPEFKTMKELLDYVVKKKIEDPMTLAALMDKVVDK